MKNIIPRFIKFAIYKHIFNQEKREIMPRFSGNKYCRFVEARYIILFLGVFVVSGCAKMSHLDQLLTLKGLADEQDQMKNYVEEQDAKFDLMLDEMRAGTLDQYLNKGKVLRTFGEPIYVKRINKNNQEMESWLYRYTTEFFDSEKIYLTFDSNNNLIKSEYVGENNGKVRQKTEKENGR